MLIAGNDAVACHAVLFPSRAFGEAVEQHRLKTVDRSSEFRLGCLARFEFVPQRAQFTALIDGQQAKNAVGGFGFAFMLVSHARGIVSEGVTSVDFHEIVNDEHFQDAEHIEWLDVAMLGENDDEERQVPGVLCVVFAASTLRDKRLPEDFLEFVHFDDEADLLGQSFVCHCPS